MKFASRIHPGYGPAACADFDDFRHGCLDRVAGGLAGLLDVIFGGYADPAVFDQCALGRCAADIEHDQVGFADQLAQVGGCEDAAGRPGFDHRDGVAFGGLRCGDASVGLHHAGAAAEAALLEVRLQPFNVGFGDWMQVGRQHSGIGALVLPPFAGHFVGSDHRSLRPQAPDFLGGALFVGRVDVVMEKGDGNCFDAFAFEVVDLLRKRTQVHGLLDLPVIGGSLGKLQSQVPVNEGPGLAEIEVEQIRPVAPRYFQHVPEAPCCDQCGLRSLALRERVDDHRASMSKEIKLGRRQVQLVQARHDPDFKVRWRGVNLGATDLAAILPDMVEHEVGKCPAHVAGGARNRPTLHQT